jgi:hypothetical protein
MKELKGRIYPKETKVEVSQVRPRQDEGNGARL